jgi:hypothetical protein
MLNKTLLIVFTIVAALGLLGIMEVVSISVPEQQQVAEAKSVVGECASFFKNASSSLCHNFK